MKVNIILETLFTTLCLLWRTTSSKEHDWDLLIFTQHWPVTVCLQWKEKMEQHTCAFPSAANEWTIHGVWPTRLGGWGPQYCNSSLHFDINALAPIRATLDQKWIDVYNGGESALWKHEWQRHGTCAVSLPALDSEYKYFSQGLDWINKYDMRNVLSKGGIELDSEDGFSAQQISDAVKNVIGFDADIQCVQEKGKSYLFEIRICFNKSLQLVDCDGIKSKEKEGSVITNCPKDKPILYPSKLPPLMKTNEISNYEYMITSKWPLKLLKIIQFLQWFTF